MILTLVVGVLAFGIGLGLGRLGQWTRLHNIEDRLRSISVACRVAEDFGEPLGPDWVADQIDWAVAEDFR